ncbi:MAG TPA: Tm-1-like ATP-binding domain-containing protein, partial [Planctomycetota bacterium]|nr:Tm-1-like ATP-binding domain-containing protein [Planctomycetota bacterium]
SANTTIAAKAMRALPVGFPKVLVSTLASGDVSPWIDTKDIALIYSVVDIAGINRISARILTNAARAVVAMAQPYTPPPERSKGLIAATMFGVTTPCVTAARRILEGAGWEVLVFHATGTGGRAMEALIADGFIAGVLDITTTELADELVGGVLSAGPDRLRAAGRAGIPQVVSVGAVDMVNFGPPETVPERFRGRKLHRHNPAITLMRTTVDECAEIGRRIAERLSDAKGRVSVLAPLRGVSAIDIEGQPFHDPEAGRALRVAIRENLPPGISYEEIDTDINDPAFARRAAESLLAIL